MVTSQPVGFSHQPGQPAFQSTRWSVVMAAGQSASPAADRALETLCSAYWYPLYAFARRRGLSSHDAMDQTQAFFARMLEKEYLRAADQERGRFRSFLLTMFKRFLSKQDEHASAQKRGGGVSVISLNVDSAENLYLNEPADNTTAEDIYERRWALTLLDRVLQALRNEFQDKDRLTVFGLCREHLTGSSVARPYAEIASDLGMTEAAVKVTVHRMRQRYRLLLRNEVAQTVNSESEVDDELKRLLVTVRG